MINVFVIALTASLAAATVVTALIVRYASRLKLMDIPNPRSSHLVPAPTGGGLGIVAGVAVGLLVFGFSSVPFNRQLGAVLIGSATIASLGALDDLRPVSIRLRLVTQTAVAIAVLTQVGSVGRLPLPAPLDLSLGWLAWPLSIVWLVGVTNFFNFMDGIDGLAGGQAVASFCGVAVAAWSFSAVQLAAIAIPATIGFLFFNRPPARVFLGDVGSTALGFTIAATPLLASPDKRSAATLAVGLGLALFLLDPAETLLRQFRAGHRLGIAHRLHSYQRIASSTGHSTWVAVSLVLVGLALSIAGGLAYRIPLIAWPVIVAALALFAAERTLAAARSQSWLAPLATKRR
jgi:UDP-N-acetylmuramyl pentapeptide phosphotransferase/UDP-N-acetylglucosamine-1-phosphate transferase